MKPVTIGRDILGTKKSLRFDGQKYSWVHEPNTADVCIGCGDLRNLQELYEIFFDKIPDFVPSKYKQAFDDYHAAVASKKQTREEAERLLEYFSKNHANVLSDPDFARFCFAWCTQKYLYEGNKFGHVVCLLNLGIRVRYLGVPFKEGKDVSHGSPLGEKAQKYLRDAFTHRGAIKILAREITCGCMDAKKAEAQIGRAHV